MAYERAFVFSVNIAIVRHDCIYDVSFKNNSPKEKTIKQLSDADRHLHHSVKFRLTETLRMNKRLKNENMKLKQVLSCQPRVTETSCFVYKVIRNLYYTLYG